jgi:hypothetical protein
VVRCEWHTCTWNEAERERGEYCLHKTASNVCGVWLSSLSRNVVLHAMFSAECIFLYILALGWTGEMSLVLTQHTAIDAYMILCHHGVGVY